MKLKLTFYYFFTLGFVLNSFSQQKIFEFKNFTQENGLPGNECYFIYRDSRDFLWISTEDGIVRYNGSRMEYFDLPDNVIFKIREDNIGRVWFFSHTGKLSYFYNEAIHPYAYNDSITKYCKNLLITDAYVKDNGDIIINSGRFENYKISAKGIVEHVNLYDIEPNAHARIRIDQIGKNIFFSQKEKFHRDHSKNKIIDIVRVVNGHKVIYQVPVRPEEFPHHGCVSADGKTIYYFLARNLVRLNEDGSFKVKYFRSNILSCSMATDHTLWVGFMNDGAVLVNDDLEEISDGSVLAEKSITSIRKDYEGGTWFSTLEKGVFYLKNSSISLFSGDSILSGPVFRLYNLGDSGILFGKYNGVYKLSNNLAHLVMPLNCKKICDLFIDEEKNIYVTGGFLIAGFPFIAYEKSKDIFFKKVYTFKAISEMVQPIPQKYWVSTYENVFEFNHKPDAALQSDKNYIPIRLIDSSIAKPGILYSDRKNQVWLGTINALYKFNSARSRPERFQPQTEILNNGITAIQQMENGIYIFGARFGGIVLMNDTSIIGNITEKQGLLSNAIKYLLVLNNDIWVATAKGISVIRFQSYNPLKYTIVNIGKNDGLYDVIIFQLMPYRGAILASTSNGIYEIDRPDELLNKQPKPIPFFINSVSYYKADTNAISSITLPYNNNRVVIKYGAICFNSPEEIKYSYRLGLKDTSWHSISSTELLLENLIPGTYNLELKAEIPGQHRFSGIMALRIIVESAWWQNIWLILTAIGMLSLIFILIYKRRIRVIEKREEQNSIINRRMTELEQAALRSQMNPHFIFNCLTSIQHLIVAGNKTEASEYLVKFGRLIRKTMDLSIYSYITIEEELNYLTEYMVLEQLRIPDQFDYFIDVDPVIDKHHLLIQSMMLQPIVENCIRHGIKHLKDRKGIITISMKRSENYIDCIITDNGIGRDANLPDASKNTYTEHKSYGLNIVKKRLATLHGTGQDEMIGIQDLYDSSGSVSGTCVTIHLPFKKTDNP